MPRAQLSRIEPRPCRRPRCQVLHEYVRPRHDTVQQGVVRVVLDVEDEGFLAPVEPDEPGALAGDVAVVVAGEVALRPLDLDDARARVREAAGGEGRGYRLLHRDHQEARERPVARLAHGPTPSCPESFRASTFFIPAREKLVDGQDKPGHDEVESACKGMRTSLART